MNGLQINSQLLHDHHLRATAARARLWKVISEFAGPFTAEQVAAKIAGRKPAVHRATVFRDLDKFVSSGILTELAVRGSKCRLFEKSERVNTTHFVCKSCGLVSLLESDTVEAATEKESLNLSRQGYRVEAIGIKIYGWCKQCIPMKGGSV
jgi:Fur family ferric uptake transcriptional regulator